jgi:D-beta-D-heptose 7-phosphate kinase/D-beta-D-heptose 1-phosphate adenosyltransferase
MDMTPPANDSLPGSPVPDLVAAVRRLARASVLVIGDVMLDRYAYGQVTRISPEAPVPILTV